MNASAANVDLLERVAAKLGHLRERIVFLGGATTSLFLTDPAAPPMRPTDDVDVIVEVASTMEYKTTLRGELLALGCKEDVDGPNCRWIIDSVKLDVMPWTRLCWAIRTNGTRLRFGPHSRTYFHQERRFGSSRRHTSWRRS
jgi:hypothetical protein